MVKQHNGHALIKATATAAAAAAASLGRAAADVDAGVGGFRRVPGPEAGDCVAPAGEGARLVGAAVCPAGSGCAVAGAPVVVGTPATAGAAVCEDKEGESVVAEPAGAPVEATEQHTTALVCETICEHCWLASLPAASTTVCASALGALGFVHVVDVHARCAPSPHTRLVLGRFISAAVHSRPPLFAHASTATG